MAMDWRCQVKVLIVLVVLLALCNPPCVAADETPTPGDGFDCILYGDGWALVLDAPEKWIVECRGPTTNDVEVALYPKESSWADATVVMYVNTIVPEKGQTLEEFALESVESFKEQQPTVEVTEAPPLPTHDKKPAIVRYFSGDKWDNHEAVAYIDGDDIRLVVVLSSRSKETFDNSIAAFHEFIRTAYFADMTIKR